MPDKNDGIRSSRVEFFDQNAVVCPRHKILRRYEITQSCFLSNYFGCLFRSHEGARHEQVDVGS